MHYLLVRRYVISGVTYQGFMKYIVASILCLSLFSTPTYALDVDKGGRDLPLPIFPLPEEPDYPQKPDDCDETLVNKPAIITIMHVWIPQISSITTVQCVPWDRHETCVTELPSFFEMHV